ncbi:ATPase family associated with various cellular activities (AAA) [Dyadobacter koreensis]|uniref:ATPase family associated with various cellular activities (AAA) n=1 Tax=Dyadobacter koreensis TaxID=408657 RepID=A0A1H6WHZ0_9BACT|nr:ATP-binding protein [Dyadobacter koreensis]SEJ16641.1 ATPase family associated with various cellular activities (AAA) [Dyadobacter koreensis]
MRQELLTRLFRAMEGERTSPLLKVAYSIIEEEKKKGHERLADQLTTILSSKEASKDVRAERSTPSLRLVKDIEYKVPVDRRYKLPLAKHTERDHLRHEMVLSDEVGAKISRIEKEYLGRERLAHHGLKPRRKILFYGSSGCGKTMAAERIAWDLGLPFYKVRFDSIISSYLGESASNLQSLFESLSDFPCVLLLDEFDIIGKQRNSSSNEVGEIHRIVNVLLGLLEEYQGEGILVATTNLESSLDKALFRRFDDIIEFQKPTELEIEKLLKISFSALKLNKEIDLKMYAKKMVGHSYAIIVKIANDAAKKSIISLRPEISNKDIESAFMENVDLTK